MKTYYIIELEKGVWLTTGCGDPPRTLVVENARRYPTKSNAENSWKYYKRANAHRKFGNVKIVRYENE